jgi:hypothetical protein
VDVDGSKCGLLGLDQIHSLAFKNMNPKVEAFVIFSCVSSLCFFFEFQPMPGQPSEQGLLSSREDWQIAMRDTMQKSTNNVISLRVWKEEVKEFPSKQHKELFLAFESIDTNFDGVVTLAEFDKINTDRGTTTSQRQPYFSRLVLGASSSLLTVAR